MGHPKKMKNGTGWSMAHARKMKNGTDWSTGQLTLQKNLFIEGYGSPK